MYESKKRYIEVFCQLKCCMYGKYAQRFAMLCYDVITLPISNGFMQLIHRYPQWLLHWPVGIAWWRHKMETFSALLAICAGNSPVPGEFPAQRPVTRSFDVFFYLRPNKRLSKQSRGWWFKTPSRPLWRHCNGTIAPNCYNAENVTLNIWVISTTTRRRKLCAWFLEMYGLIFHYRLGHGLS